MNQFIIENLGILRVVMVICNMNGYTFPITTVIKALQSTNIFITLL